MGHLWAGGGNVGLPSLFAKLSLIIEAAAWVLV